MAMIDPRAVADIPVLNRIVEGRFDDPFSVLGPHRKGRLRYVTAYDPGATEMAALVEKHLVKQGVGVITGASVTEVCADCMWRLKFSPVRTISLDAYRLFEQWRLSQSEADE